MIFPAPLALTNDLASLITPLMPKLALFFKVFPALFSVPFMIPLTVSLNASFVPFRVTFLSTSFNLSDLFPLLSVLFIVLW